MTDDGLRSRYMGCKVRDGRFARLVNLHDSAEMLRQLTA